MPKRLNPEETPLHSKKTKATPDDLDLKIIASFKDAVKKIGFNKSNTQGFQKTYIRDQRPYLIHVVIIEPDSNLNDSEKLAQGNRVYQRILSYPQARKSACILIKDESETYFEKNLYKNKKGYHIGYVLPDNSPVGTVAIHSSAILTLNELIRERFSIANETLERESLEFVPYQPTTLQYAEDLSEPDDDSDESYHEGKKGKKGNTGNTGNKKTFTRRSKPSYSKNESLNNLYIATREDSEQEKNINNNNNTLITTPSAFAFNNHCIQTPTDTSPKFDQLTELKQKIAFTVTQRNSIHENRIKITEEIAAVTAKKEHFVRILMNRLAEEERLLNEEQKKYDESKLVLAKIKKECEETEKLCEENNSFTLSRRGPFT